MLMKVVVIITQPCVFKPLDWQPFSPRVANTPQADQMRRQGPTAPEYSRTAVGEMKIPEPIIVPTIRQMPLTRPT